MSVLSRCIKPQLLFSEISMRGIYRGKSAMMSHSNIFGTLAMLAGCEANFEPDAGRSTNQERALKYNNIQ